MTTTLVEQERATHVTSNRAESMARRYLAAFLLVGIVLCILPFVLERVPALQRFSASDWGRRLDYTYTLAHTDADIVLFGDSSALYGIDTPRLSTELGLRVINLSQSIGTLVINGDAPLRYYLANNKPPRTIVFAFVPWNQDFRSVRTTLVYEGIEQLIRHGSLQQVLHTALTRPKDLARFPLSFYLVHSRFTRLWRPYELPYRLRDGFEPYAADAAPVSAPCTFSQQQLPSNADNSLQQLQADATQRNIQFVSVLSPVPQCSNLDRLKALYGSDLTVLPASYFADDTFLAHSLPAHSNEITDRIAGILRSALESTNHR